MDSPSSPNPRSFVILPPFRVVRPLLLLASVLFAICPIRVTAQTTYFWRSESTNGNWNDSNNWWNGSTTAVPAGGDIIRFNNGIQLTMTNNLAATSRYRIYFDSGTGARTIGGTTANTFYDYGGLAPLIQNDDADTQTINFDIINGNSSGVNALDINANSGQLIFGGNISASGGARTIYAGGSNNLTFNGALRDGSSAALSFYKQGTGTATLAGNGNFTGTTSVTAGVVAITHASALGSTSGGTTVSSGAALQLSGGISVGAEALTLNGAGISNGGALRNTSGNNSWAGGITLNSGARINSDSGTLTISGTVGAGANTLYVGGAGDTTISGSLSGTQTGGDGALFKNGTGTLTLSGANTGLTGLTLLGAGTLSAASNSNLTSGTIQMGDGATTATLAITGGDTTRTGGIAIANTSNASVISITSGTTYMNGTLSQAGGTTDTTKFGKAGAGTLYLGSANTYAGQIQIGEGNVILANNTASGTNNSTTNRGIDLGLNVGDVSQGNSVGLYVLNGITSNASIYVAPNTSSATRTIGLSGSGSGGFSNEIFIDQGVNLTGGSGTATFSGAFTGCLTNSPTIRIAGGTVVFTNNSSASGYNGTTVINSGATLQLGNAGTSGWVGNTSGITNNGTLRYDRTDNVSTSLAISGTGALTKNGTGTLTLSGANSYSGGTTMNAGVLNINSATAIGSGALVLNQTATTIDNTSGAAITLANNNNITVHNFTFTGTNDLSFGSGTATLGSTRTITVSGGNLTIGSIDAQFTNVGLTKSGTGRLILSNAAGSNFQGGTTLSAGTLSLGNKSALGTGTLTISAASTALSATANLGGANAVANAINLRANSSIVGSNNLTLSGALTQNGSNFSLTVNNSGATEFSGPIYLSEASGTGRTLTLVATTNATVSGAISNFNGSGTAGVLRKDGAGALVLSNSSSSYTGRTETQAAGILSVAKLANGGSNSSIGASSNAAANLVFANGTTLLYTGSGDSTDRLFTIDGNGAGFGVAIDASGSGALNFTNTGSITHSTNAQTRTLTLQGNNTADNTFALLLANNGGGALSLAKSGTGTWVLTGNSTYTGATTVNAGALTVGHANALGATAGGVTVSSGAALQLTGGIAVGAEALGISGDGIGSGGALRNLSGANSYAGAITLGAATRINSDAGTLTLSGGISGTQNLTIGGAGNTTVSGTIATGTGTLAKDGLGTLVLSANNTYTGATTITAGTLQLGAGGTAGNVTSDITNNSALVVDRSNNFTYGNIISGSGTLTKNGTGTLTLTANNTMSGNTTVNAGGLTLNNASGNALAGNITVAGGTLTLSSDSQTAAGKAVAMTSGSIALGTTTQTFGSLAMSGGNMTRQGGVLTLAGASSFTGGNVIFTAAGSGITNSAAVTLGNANFLYGGSVTHTAGFVLGGNVDVNNSATASFNNTDSGAGELDLGSATRTFTVGNSANLNVNWVVSGSGNLTKSGAGTMTLNATNTYSGNTTVTAGTLATSGANQISTGTSLDVQGGTFQLGGNQQFASAQGAGNITLGGNTLTLGSNNANTTLSGTLSGAGGGLTKQGTGTLTLSGPNSYTGATAINAGAVRASNATALGTTAGGTTVASGAALELSGGIIIGAEALNLSGTGISSGGALRNIDSDNSYAGAVTLAAATRINSDAGTLSLGGGISGTFNLTIGGAGNTTVGSVVGTSSGTLTKDGAGTLTLSGNNTYSGGTTLSVGTLALGHKNALGTGTLTISTASTALSSTTDLGGANAVANEINLRNNSSIVGSNNLTLSGALTQNGSNLSLTVNNSGATELAGPIYLSEASGTGRTLTLVATTNATVSGAISNFNGSGTEGAFRKNGAGALVLSNSSSSYTGRTETQAGGILSVAKLSNGGSNSSIGASSNAAGNLVLAIGTTLLYTGSGDSTDRLFTIDGSGAGLGVAIDASGSGALNFTNSGGITHSSSGQTRTLTLQGNNSADNTFALLIANNGGGVMSLTKNGTGTWVLTGNSTYTGATTVNAGALTVGHANALGNTAGGVTVSSGAALQLTGGIAVGAEALGISGDGIGSGGALRNLSGANSYAGAITLGAATRINSDAGTLTLSGGISGTQNLTIGGAGNTTVSGTIATGTGTLAKDGLGTLVLSANNTYTGATTITAGTLQLGAGGTAGNVTSDITNNSALVVDRSNNFTYGNIISGSGTLTKNGTGTLTLTTNNTMSGNTTVNAGSLTLNNASGNALGGNITVAGGTLTLTDSDNQTAAGKAITMSSGSIALSASKQTFGSLMMSGGNLTRGGDILTLSDASSFTGGTVSLTSGSARIVTAGTTTLGNVNFTTGSTISANNGLVLGGNVLMTSGTANFTNTANLGRIDLGSSDRTFDLGAGTALNSDWAIVGTGGLVKSGAGTMTLNATNAYSGNTTVTLGTLATSGANQISTSTHLDVQGGTFQLGGSQTFASARGAGAINLGANTLTIGSNNESTTLSGVISGSGGGLTKQGSGTLTLSNTGNTYSGATNINAGTLVLSGTNTSSAITIASGATLAGSGTGGAVTVNGIISPGTSPGILTVGDLTLNSGGSYTWEIANATGAAGTGWDQIVASGQLTVASTAGSRFTIAITSTGAPTNWNYLTTGQTWDIIDYGTISGFDATKFTISTSGFGGTTDAGSSWSLSDAGSALRLTYTYTAGTPTWSGGAGNWNAEFTPAISNGLDAIFTGSGGTATNNIPSATLTNIGSLTFNSTAGAYTLAADSGSSGFNAASALVINGDITNNSTNTQTINLALSYAANENVLANSGNIVLGGPVAVANAQTLVLSGNITMSGSVTGAGALSKNSTGVLTLSGSNSLSGGVAASAGTLLLGNNNALGAGNFTTTGSVTIASTDSTARMLETSYTSLSGSSVTVTFGQASGGTGALTFNGTGDLALGTGTRTFQVLNTTTLNGALTGAASLTKTGAGTLVLAGNSTYGSAGTTTISAGTLQIGSGGATGSISTPSIVNNAALLVNRTGSLTLSGNMSGTGTLTKNGSGTLILTGSNTYDGATTINTGALRASTLNALGSTAAGTTVASGAALELIGGIAIGAEALSLTGSGDSSTGALRNISGANSYAGAITLGGATTIGSDAGTLTLTGGLTGTNTNLIIVGAGATTVSTNGLSIGSGTLTKNGSGTLTLNTANTYTGATTVNSGTLQAAAAGALGASSNIDINGGSLLVTAASSINDSAAINLNSGTLAVSGSFDENVGQLTLSANSIIDLDGFSGILRFGGVGSWASGATLAIWNWSGQPLWGPPVNNYANPSQIVFADKSNLTPNLASISFYSGSGTGFIGNAFEQDFNISDFNGTEIIPVPEPETYLTGLILFLGFGIYQFRLARQGRGHLHRFTFLRHGFKR